MEISSSFPDDVDDPMEMGLKREYSAETIQKGKHARKSEPV